MIQTFGTSINGKHIYTSNTLKGAKRYATINGLTNITMKIRYFSYILFNKVGNKWVKTSLDTKVILYDLNVRLVMGEI